MTKKNGKTQVTLTTCILCNKPFSSGYLKKRMNETRQFLDWHKSKGKQNYLPAYTIQFCPKCDEVFFGNAKKRFGGYKQWPHVALCIVPPGTDPRKPPQHLVEFRPELYMNGEELRSNDKLTFNPQD